MSDNAILKAMKLFKSFQNEKKNKKKLVYVMTITRSFILFWSADISVSEVVKKMGHFIGH